MQAHAITLVMSIELLKEGLLTCNIYCSRQGNFFLIPCSQTIDCSVWSGNESVYIHAQLEKGVLCNEQQLCSHLTVTPTSGGHMKYMNIKLNAFNTLRRKTACAFTIYMQSVYMYQTQVLQLPRHVSIKHFEGFNSLIK